MTMNGPSLEANNELLQDGLNDGFRAPDLGWVGTQRDTELEAEHFNTGSLVFSNFWSGPLDQAKAFAEALVEDFRAWLAVVEPEEDGEEFIPAVSVCYWEDVATGLGLVATQSITPDFMLCGEERPEGFPSLERFQDTMRQLADDSNDNYPANLLYELSEPATSRSEATTILALITAAAADREDSYGDLRRAFSEQYPSAKSGRSP